MYVNMWTLKFWEDQHTKARIMLSVANMMINM